MMRFMIWAVAFIATAVSFPRLIARDVSRRRNFLLAGVPDLSSRDNAALAIATSTITAALVNLFDRGLIDGSELVRMVYRFAGEVVDIDEVVRKAKVNPPKKVETRGRKKGIPNQKGAKVDMETGDLKGSVEA